jgi:5-methyltetrahydropteroyltriglutamate--homocysteine methyltransferase
MKTNPPFRAEHVGSLLRPTQVKDARARFAEGILTAAELAMVEDDAIAGAIRQQESIGLRSVTDGEIRRATWFGDFLGALDGMTLISSVIRPKGDPTSPGKTIQIPTVTGKIAFSRHPMIEHFQFLQQSTKAMPKMTIPAPAMIVSALRDWRHVVNRDVYPDVREFYHDLAAAYRSAVRAFYDAGCRYLQFDDVNLAYLCDASKRTDLAARGDDPDAMLQTWVDVVNAAIAGRPADMTISTHICRGNFQSTWLADGDYAPVADTLFNRFDYDGYFLEYDTDRAGGFEPLRFVPRGKKLIVLGLITTKAGKLEDKDLVKARIEAATKFVDIDQLGLSPQCGFASTQEGNLITEDEQWAKLRSVVELAREVWTDA